MPNPSRRSRRRPAPYRRFRRRTGIRMVNPDLNVDSKVPAPMSLPLTRNFRIRLSNILSCTSNASGVINTLLNADPSSTTSSFFGTITQFPEWATWAGLFGEVRLLQFEVRLTPVYIDDTKGDSAFSIAIGGDLTPNVQVPGSYSNVTDDSDSQVWMPSRDYSGRAKYHSIRPGNNLPFAATTTPGGGTTVAAGCPGGIQFYGSGLPTSATMFDVTVTGYYQLRSKS